MSKYKRSRLHSKRDTWVAALVSRVRLRLLYDCDFGDSLLIQL